MRGLGFRFLILGALLISTGCDLIESDDSSGGLTQCTYAYEATTVPGDFGIRCTDDSQCNHEECIMSDDSGNVTNNVFGFCSRGCDCEDSEDASLSGDNPDYECVYPGGCFPGQSQGGWRYVVPKCASLDDCLAIDESYTHCNYTGSQTTVDTTCGDISTKVCLAIQ